MQSNNLTTSTKCWIYFSFKLELNQIKIDQEAFACLSSRLSDFWSWIVFGLNMQKTLSAHQFSQWFIGFFMYTRWKTFITWFWTLAKDLNMMIWQLNDISILKRWHYCLYLMKVLCLYLICPIYQTGPLTL